EPPCTCYPRSRRGPTGCMRTRLSKEGREEGPWGHGPRFKQEKELDHVAIRITLIVTASRRQPAPEDRPQGHRGPCRQHQDRWRPAQSCRQPRQGQRQGGTLSGRHWVAAV